MKEAGGLCRNVWFFNKDERVEAFQKHSNKKRILCYKWLNIRLVGIENSDATEFLGEKFKTKSSSEPQK